MLVEPSRKAQGNLAQLKYTFRFIKALADRLSSIKAC